MRPSSVRFTFRSFLSVASIAVFTVLIVSILATSSTLSAAGAAQATAVPTRQSGGTQRAACPDTNRPITTATPLPVGTATAINPNATPTAPGLRVITSSLIRNIQDMIKVTPTPQVAQPGQTPLPPIRYDIIHSIVMYDPGISSGWNGYTGDVSFIVIEGQILLCRGTLQRLINTWESWTIPANQGFALTNIGSVPARLSMVRFRPNPSATTANENPSYLGIRVIVVPNTGLRVQQVLGGSPAQAAGLQVNDVLTAIDNVPVNSLVLASLAKETDGYAIITAFFDVIEQHRPGDVVTLTVLRNNQPINIQVRLAPLPQGVGNTGQ